MAAATAPASVGRVELNLEEISFNAGERGELLIGIDLTKGSVIVAYLFSGDDLAAFDLYIVEETPALSQLRWSQHKHHELSEHERQALATCIPRTKR